ncbi:MAG: hypothetical protein EP332_05130 [Bacteroidetes bacterium]|nr:MAG: hypothetical protein EP332_05130 [Bacteroidota bacterium]
MKKQLYYFCIAILLFSCEKGSDDINLNSSIGSEGVGVGGSLARFAIVGNSLFTVDHQSLNQFTLDANGIPNSPLSRVIGDGIETIFPFKGYLYIGTMTGMHIYDISNGGFSHLSITTHITSCDPVVANDSLAFLTLRSNPALGRCMRGANELQVYDVTDPINTKFISRTIMQSPLGLGLFQNKLFVCDKGIKVFDYSNPAQPSLIQHLNTLEVMDVIPLQNHLLFLAPDALYQYAYSNNNFQLISKLSKDL